jgi:hypothetical protein
MARALGSTGGDSSSGNICFAVTEARSSSSGGLPHYCARSPLCSPEPSTCRGLASFSITPSGDWSGHRSSGSADMCSAPQCIEFQDRLASGCSSWPSRPPLPPSFLFGVMSKPCWRKLSEPFQRNSAPFYPTQFAAEQYPDQRAGHLALKMGNFGMASALFRGCHE